MNGMNFLMQKFCNIYFCCLWLYRDLIATNKVSRARIFDEFFFTRSDDLIDSFWAVSRISTVPNINYFCSALNPNIFLELSVLRRFWNAFWIRFNEKKPKDGTLNSLLISTSTALLNREHVHMLNKLNWFSDFDVYFDNYSNFSADLFLSFSFRSACWLALWSVLFIQVKCKMLIHRILTHFIELWFRASNFRSTNCTHSNCIEIYISYRAIRRSTVHQSFIQLKRPKTFTFFIHIFRR